MKLHLNLLTPDSLVGPTSAEAVLDLICDTSSLAPDRYSYNEPIKVPFTPSSRTTILKEWNKGLLWKKNSPRSVGAVWTDWSNYPKHGWITITSDSDDYIDDLVAFIHAASVRLQADFACLHTITEPDLAIGYATDTIFMLDPKTKEHDLTVTSFDLNKYIPDLYFGTVFGPAYVSFFGKQTLMTVPAPIVMELASEVIYVQISTDLHDLEENPKKYVSVRDSIKQHLGTSAFFDPKAELDYAYRTAAFTYER